MAEVKNSFLKSKMNQDLDDRLIPNGEYRYANNISVGKSETDDIGALQNILGNELLALTNNSEFIPGTTTPNPNYIFGLECIGLFMDNQNNRIFQFLTNYTDPDPNNIIYPSDGNMKITMYDLDSPESYTTLVEGLFLNFAKNKEFRITGVNLIEGLLFWTDNRNQPRKINVLNASNPNYYTAEHQISVAKYAPVDPINLYKKVIATANGVSIANTINVEDANGIVPGMTLITSNISGDQFCIVTDVTLDPLPAPQTVTFYENLPSPIADGEKLTFLISTMTDKSSVPSWPGDPAFLEDKYIRFSYRFKYDDNEYSLMAPFTQIAYIPKQKGYFIAGNEIDAYRSTIINWFENNVNNIELIIPLPDKIGNLTNNYKVKEIDILYKESDSLAVKVFETLEVSSINTNANSNNNYYIQPYQSQKPYRTLSEDQTIRVYDKVPVKAKAQESAGNRIIYGNYYDKYTCLSSINYNISIQPKSTISTNFIEYPNHTLKKNRNYQVGFILADKFGRQSPVILSSVDLIGLNLGGGAYAKGSTVYSSYENSVLFDDVRTWFGDTLILYLNSPIYQQKDIPAGKPGLYAIPTSNLGFAITASVITDMLYTYTLDITAATNTTPVEGDILRGYYTDYVTVLSDPLPTANPNEYSVVTSGRVNDIYNYNDPGGGILDIKFSYIYNPIGWYSYKIVVKQQEDDYYNVYLPGMLNGYPENQTYGSQVIYSTSGSTTTPTLENGINITQFPVNETGNTAHIVLINDNINKVPRDLSEVGPDQKQYRSSVQLYGRVENVEDSLEIIGKDPLYSAKVIEIFYDIATAGNEDWALISPGDGIQCVEANTPIPNAPPLGGTQPNPYRWLKDTVVVSNKVTGTTGTITLSSPNWIIDTTNPLTTYKTFTITRAENKQYFPTRKADTVTSIATAAEFNFLDNSADNLSGTAALNFYQLQNSPLIGRVSTVNRIGVVAQDMIPFLSVYETRPEQTLLQLFWETATTGLISDLNADTLTGFDGPSSFSDPNYIHFEYQNPYGLGEDTGAEDSKWVTDLFAVLNQNNIILPNTTAELLSVIDGTGQDRTNDFGLASITTGLNATYRLYIKKPTPPDNAGNFVFNNTAGPPTFLESYVFTIKVTDYDNPSPPSTITNLTINGRLGNNAPIITTSVVNYSITQTVGAITTLTAINGAFYNEPIAPPRVKTGLKWSIIGGDTPVPSFNIDPYSGILSLTNPNVPLDRYELEIKVQDAVNTTTGQITPVEGDDFGTKFATITLFINVGDQPVPYWLRPGYFGISGFGGTTCAGDQVPYPYGMIYIGRKKDFGIGYAYLPQIPGSNKNYFNTVVNVEVANATQQGFPDIIPTGLETGSFRIGVKLEIRDSELCNPSSPTSFTRASTSIYLYRRSYNPNNTGDTGWVLVRTGNNILNSPTGPNYTTPEYRVNAGDGKKILTTWFAIDSVEGAEWAIGIKINTTGQNTKGIGSILSFECEDANYSYGVFPNVDYSMPILVPYTYYTGVANVDGYTSAIPYTTQDAAKGISYAPPSDNISTGAINAGNPIVNLTLAAVNNQVAPGLKATIVKSGITVGTGTVVEVGPSDIRDIVINLNSGFVTTPSLSGGTVQFATFPNNGNIGILYANVKEGTELKRFYTDSNFTQPWIPPFSERFYVFQTTKSYDPQNTLRVTKYPYYSAKFNNSGEVITPIPATTPNSQTAWGMGVPVTPADLNNASYNLSYKTI